MTNWRSYICFCIKNIDVLNSFYTLWDKYRLTRGLVLKLQYKGKKNKILHYNLIQVHVLLVFILLSNCGEESNIWILNLDIMAIYKWSQITGIRTWDLLAVSHQGNQPLPNPDNKSLTARLPEFSIIILKMRTILIYILLKFKNLFMKGGKFLCFCLKN